MKICFIGKYPPIEGGVSASTYWLAYGLAQRGHEISVVTNADEVEEEYRMHMGPEDSALYAPDFRPAGGRVEVFPTERDSPRMSHIPTHNPYATKLSGIATEVVRSRGCELIFAYYFEPYGIAANLAATWTGVPWIVRHAGSDLDRLMRIPQLATAHKEALRSADGVVAGAGLAERFVGMGVARERVYSAQPWVPSPEFFHPDAEPLDVDALPKTLAPERDGEPVSFDPSRPTIGIYGKVGPAKGSFDLLRALAMLRREGLEFNFLALTQGWAFEAFVEAVRELELVDRTWIVPFLPNWRVPSFLKTCTAVCFLERDFPVKIHTPVVAREVLSTGTCLVVSGEIAAKQSAFPQMADGDNLFIVDDPKVHSDLAAKLRVVLEDPEAAREVGLRGTSLAGDTGDFDRYVESWEQIMLRAAGHDSTAQTFAELATAPGADEAEGDGTDGLAWRMPWLKAVLPDQAEALLESFRSTPEAAAADDPMTGVVAFGEYLGAHLASNGFGADKALAEACLRFQAHRSRALRDDEESRKRPAFAAVDRLCGAAVTRSEARSLRPLRSRHAEVLELDYDVTPLFTGSQEVDATDVEKRRTLVCFLRAPNLLRTELKLSQGVKDLFDLCDGSRTTQEVLDTLARRRGIEPSQRRSYDEQVLGALQNLYDHRILVFCSHRPT